MELEPGFAADVAYFKQMRRVLAEERAFAVTVIHRLLEMQTVPSRPHSQSWISAGMVIELEATVPRIMSRTPERSARLAHLATVIAAALDETYPAILRAESTAGAWGLVASVRRHHNQYEPALEALDVADRALEPFHASVHEKATLALTRAAVYAGLRRTEEARCLVHEARTVFDGLTDVRRKGRCDLLVGIIHYGEGDVARASAAYQHALAAARATGDESGEAMVHLNMAVAEAEHGAATEAVQALHRAVAVLEVLGRQDERARATRIVAAALRTAGRYETAVPLFREARGASLSLGRIEEAGLAGLGLAETYLALGRRAAATRLIVAMSEQSREARLDERAREALGSLLDPDTELSPDAVRKVYVTLEGQQPEPRMLFP